MPNQARAAQPRYYISRRIPFRVQEGDSLVSREPATSMLTCHGVRKSFVVVTQPPSITLMHYL